MSLASPALADKYFAVTPSGATETLFADKPQTVSGQLAARCMDAKWTVVSSTPNHVTCEAPLNMGQSILGQMLMGNSYSTPPRRFYRFGIAEINGISRVQATGWMELQMAFGQIKRNDFSGPEFHNSAMNFMASAGGKLPPGTTFPNHAVLGFESEQASLGKINVPRVTKIEPGSAAEKSGMQVGDLVTRVAGERLKSQNDYLDAAAKAASSSTYEVEVMRSGKALKLTLQRAFRPAWTEQVVAIAPSATTLPQQVPTSVADELAKLAKLRSDGVLSEQEFLAQKSKLLGQ
ncbi:PDZ domain-containing protein [Sphingomonas kaistensis]|uniref:PDZ domain-containing protein n=1 Tax=Sphingomonas kaistensis TaxID=298708 RepID=A0ABZ2G0W9_9SPHN